MNKYLLLLLTISIATITQAQTGPNLIGCLGSDGANYSGSIIRYTGGNTSLSNVYSFPMASVSGVQYLNLTEAPNGKLYGLRANGGVNQSGSIFEYDYSTNTYTDMVSMSNSTGSIPAGALLLASDGLLYGMTYTAGSGDSNVIFSYVPGSTAIHLYPLPTSTAFFAGAMIQASDGLLYGITDADGAAGSGTIFSFDIATGTYTDLYDLPSGADPWGKLTEVGADTLYGTTKNDGANGAGTLFQYIVSTGSYNIIYNFSTGYNIATSWLTLASDGRLYGLSQEDGTNTYGSIFSFDIPTSTYTDVYRFGNIANDGARPKSGLVQASDGYLYGVTNEGGINSLGTVFRYDITNAAFTKEVDLSTSTGDGPGGGNLAEYIGAPVILTEPDNDTVAAGVMTTFYASASNVNHIQWQISGGENSPFSNIQGANSDTCHFIASSQENGYLVRAVFYNSIYTDTSTIATLTLTGHDVGLLNIATKAISLNPNPTNGSFTITNNYNGPLSVSVINLLGEHLKEYTMTGSQQTFVISDLASGIYEVQISDGNQTLKVMKVVKE